MKKQDKRKQSVYLPENVLEEIKKESIRQERSISWLIKQSWIISREKLYKIPGSNDSF